MTTTSHEWNKVSVEDGTQMDLYVSRPMDEHDRHMGVIVLQEIWGVNSHIRRVADRFAQLGYTAVAPDIFHRTAPRFELPYSDFGGLVHMEKVTSEGALADLRATHAFLSEFLERSVDRAQVVSCGFCMGGRLSFVANAHLPLAGAICFYGGGISKQLGLAAKQNGPLLLFWAGQDDHISKADRNVVADALGEAKKNFTEVNVDHARHGFFCDERGSYDAEAAKAAWAHVTAFVEARSE